MRVLLCLAAEGIVVDSDSEAISVYNLLEGIAAEGFPVLLQKIAVVAIWARNITEPEDWPGQFIVEHNELALLDREIQLNFRSNLRHRTVVRLGGLVIPGPGTLKLRFAMRDGTEAMYVLEVTAPAPSMTSAEQR